MSENECVSYEDAKLIKEKGYTNESLFFYENCELKRGFGANYNNIDYDNIISAPTLHEIQQWLLNEYKISVEVNPRFEYDKLIFITGVFNVKDKKSFSKTFSDYLKAIINKSKGKEIRFNTYQEALENGIKKALKLI